MDSLRVHLTRLNAPVIGTRRFDWCVYDCDDETFTAFGETPSEALAAFGERLEDREESLRIARERREKAERDACHREDLEKARRRGEL